MGIHPNGNPDHIMGHGIWLTLYVYICFLPIWYGIQPTLATSTSTSTSSSAAFHTTHQTHSVLSAGLGWLVQPGEDLWGPMGCFIYIIIYIYIFHLLAWAPTILGPIPRRLNRLIGWSRWRFVRSAAKASFCLFLVRLNRPEQNFQPPGVDG